jgi:hypothetical protein
LQKLEDGQQDIGVAQRVNDSRDGSSEPDKLQGVKGLIGIVAANLVENNTTTDYTGNWSK